MLLAEQDEGMSPEAIRQTLRELRASQIELELQNEKLRNAQAELNASRARYFDFYNFAPVGYVTVSELGLILEANLTLGLMLGVVHSTLPGQPITRYFLRTDQDIYHDLGKKLVATGESQSCELRMLKHDGAYFWVKLKATVAQDEGAPVWRFMVSDISARKKKEAELQQSTERFELAVAGSTDGLWDWDFTTNTVYYSPRFKQLLGFAPDDPRFPNVYASLRKRLHPDDYKSTEDAIRRAVTDGVPYRAVFRLRTEAGNWRWFEARGATLRNEEDVATRFSGSISDITERKTAEEALAQEQFLMRAMLDHVPDYIYFKDRDGRMLRISRSKADVHGVRDPAQMIGKTDFDFFAEAHARQAHDDEQAIIRTGQPLTKEEKLSWPGRSDMWVSTTKVSLRDEAGNIVGTFGISRDITERKHMEEQLRGSGMRQELALSGANLGLWDWNVPSGLALFDQRWCAMIGYRPDELAPHVSTWLTLLHPDDATTVEGILQPHLRGEAAEYETEFRLRHKDGHWRWILARGKVMERNPNGAPLRMLGTHMDITERKLAEARLQESTTAVHDLTKALDEHAIVAITDPQGKITHVNDKFCAISKYSREELLGQDHRLINSGAHAKEFIRELWTTIAQGRIWHGELQNRAKDGTPYWVDTTIVPFLNEQDKPRQYVAIRADITARKLAEQALMQAKVAAESASRAKSEFLATMSHEIRTPMNGVVGFTDLLLDSALDEQQKMFVDMLKTSGQTLLSIINDILDFSYIEAGTITLYTVECDALRLIEESAVVFEPQARNLGLQWNLDLGHATSPLIIADPARFGKILGYLLSNALKFTKQGGISLHLGQVNVDGATYLRLGVSDTGIGIPPEKQAKLFQAFTQGDGTNTRQYGGTGLGLAISKKLVELMGGQIGFESEVGKGSTFWFTIPQPRSVTAEKHAPGTASPVPAPPLTVLVVEDNYVNQQVAKHHLLKQGCQVTIASNGTQAIELVQSEHFDLILMDCMMPDTDGYETTDVIRKWERQNPARPHLPIIALTANVMAGDREKCLESGMDDYLSKPIIAAQLVEIIAKWRPARTARIAGQKPRTEGG